MGKLSQYRKHEVQNAIFYNLTQSEEVEMEQHVLLIQAINGDNDIFSGTLSKSSLIMLKKKRIGKSAKTKEVE